MDQQTDDNPFIRHLDLNETLTSLPIFSCKKCNGFLTPPIRLAEGIGHVCGTCDLPETAIAIHDSNMELVLQNLTIPCPNASRGCNEKCNYVDAYSHISSCLQRNYVCPLKFLSDCSWEGVSVHILDHVNERHPENVIEADNGVFPLSVDYSVNHDVVKILQMGSDTFILRIIYYKVTKTKTKKKSETLYYLVYYIGSKEKGQEYSYSLDKTVKVGHNCALYHNSESDVLHDLRFGSGDYSDSPVSIDLTLLKKFTQQSIVETVIKIFKKNSKNEGGDESHEFFLNCLKCSICKSLMRPPIYQCPSGHNVCQDCKSRVNYCSLCSQYFNTTRNCLLETIIGHVKFPCRYQDDGCEMVLPYCDLNNHEAECEFKSYSCPLSCSWRGTRVNIIQHLKELHAEKCSFGSVAKGSLNFNGNNSEAICCIITNGDAFRMCCKQTNVDIFWTVEYVGPQSRNKHYMYEFALLNIKNGNRKLVWSDVCQNIDFEKGINYILKFPGAVFSHHDNKCVMYYCRIIQSNTV